MRINIVTTFVLNHHLWASSFIENVLDFITRLMHLFSKIPALQPWTATNKTSVDHSTQTDVGPMPLYLYDYKTRHWRVWGRGRWRASPPTGPNSFISTDIFAEKHPHQRLASPTGSAPPSQREILDPQLLGKFYTWKVLISGNYIFMILTQRSL